MICPKCHADGCARWGRYRDSSGTLRQKYRCSRCGHEFVNTETPNKHTPLSIRAAAVGFVVRGMSTREASIHVKTVFGVWVSKESVRRWARQGRIRFSKNRRRTGCQFCGSRTAHRHGCPTIKERPHVKLEVVVPY